MGNGSTALPALTFANYQPVQIELGNVDIKTEQSTQKNHEDVVYFPYDVEKALNRYLHKRFQGQQSYGSTTQTSITIKKLYTSVVDVKKEKPSFVDNFKQVFAGQTNYKIEGLMGLNMSCAFDGRQISQTLNFYKQIGVSNASSPYERDLLVIGMMEELVANIDPELIKILESFKASCS